MQFVREIVDVRGLLVDWDRQRPNAGRVVCKSLLVAEVGQRSHVGCELGMQRRVVIAEPFQPVDADVGCRMGRADAAQQKQRNRKRDSRHAERRK